MVSRKTRSCKEALGRNGMEFNDSMDQDESGRNSSGLFDMYMEGWEGQIKSHAMLH